MNHCLLTTPFWLVGSCFLTVSSHLREDDLALLPLHTRAQTPAQGPTHNDLPKFPKLLSQINSECYHTVGLELLCNLDRYTISV